MYAWMSRRGFMGRLAAGAGALAAPQLVFGTAAYGPPPGVVRLSSNENPYGPSPRALEAAAAAAARGAYYPGPVNRDLIAAIAERNGLPTDAVVTTSGSSEVLLATADAFMPLGRLLAPALTFGPHLRRAERLGGEVLRVPLTADMDQDLERMAARVDNTVALVYVCNPNNPTGVTIDGARLRAFVRAVGPKATVLVDEAYNELTEDPAGTSVVDLVRAGENVIVSRTFSKIFGLAGLRIGYAMAPPHLVDTLRRRAMTRPNLVGAAAALASLEDEAFVAFSRAKITEGRELVTDLFTRLEIPFLPSQTNFVYADTGLNADRVQAALRERNVHIRGIYRPYTTWSRVSMGRIEDLERFAAAFEEVLVTARRSPPRG